MKKFIRELKAKLIEANAIKVSEDCILHCFGETAEEGEDDKATFIRDTNAKYFNSDDSKLLGDFLEIRVKPENSFIRFDASQLFDQYKNKGLDSVMDVILDNYNYSERINGYAENLFEDMLRYNLIRDKLIIRPINYDNNKAALDKYVYERLGDIALTLYAVVFDDVERGAYNTVKIPREIMKVWLTEELTETDVMAEALKNTERIAPARLFENIFRINENIDDSFADPLTMRTKLVENCVPLLTTTRRTNGAIAIAYPSVRSKIAELIGGSYHIAFTSIHECMIHKAGTMDVASIRRHLKATNDMFGPEDTLTYEVFFYNAETGEIEVCEA